MSEALRAQFEAWYEQDPGNRKTIEQARRGDEYSGYYLNGCWKGWQACAPSKDAEIARYREALEKANLERDGLLRALEVIGVGDSKDPVTDAGDELVALGFWNAEAVTELRARSALKGTA